MSTKQDSSIKLVAVLVITCAIASLALAGTYAYCRNKIMAQNKKTKQDALSVVLADAATFTAQTKNDFSYYEAFDDNGTLIGYAFEGEAAGYSSIIKVTVGVDTTATVVKGIKVTSQQETPGLGGNMTAIQKEGTLWTAIASIGSSKTKAGPVEPWFQAQYRDKPLDKLIVVKTATDENIQALTGATISSNAVTVAVKTAISSFRQQVLDQATDATTSATESGTWDDDTEGSE